MGLFRKKQEGSTHLILDVENGSVGGTLVRLHKGQQPRLFGEKRFTFPLSSTRDSQSLLRHTAAAAEHAARHLSEVAARLRQHEKASELGNIGGVSLFMSAPWGTPNLHAGKPTFVAPAVHAVKAAVSNFFGSVPTQTFTRASAINHGLRLMYPYDTDSLSIAVGGELAELMHSKDGRVLSYATMPVGHHTFLRTLVSHGKYSPEEARSMMRLPHMSEPLRAAGGHMASEFADVTKHMFKTREIPDKVFVIAHDRSGEWVARLLTESDEVGEMFPQGGTIRRVSISHATPFVAAHSPNADLALCMEALFRDAL